MRKLIVLVLVAATLYGGYWFIGRTQIQDRLVEALDQANAGAYAVSYDSLSTRGFPSRFDTTITNVTFSDPATETSWSAPFFQIFALAYQPNEVIAVFPAEQSLVVAGTPLTLLTNDMRASGKVRPSAALAFLDTTLAMDAPRLKTEDGAEWGMASLLAAMRLTPDTTQSYDAYLEARSILLPADARRFIDPGNLQPAVVQNLRFDSDITLTAPIELNGNTQTAPALDTLSITEFAVTWGDMSLSAIGDLTAETSGLLNGSISLSARNWQQAVELGIANGMIDANRRFLVTEIANTLDETPHISDTLTLTLTVTDSALTLGGFPLGTLPSVR